MRQIALTVLVVILFLNACHERNASKGTSGKSADNGIAALIILPENQIPPARNSAGRFLVEDRCLVFAPSGSNVRYSPMFAGMAVLLYDASNHPVGVEVAGKAAKLNEQLVVLGAVSPRSQVKPNARCPKETIFIAKLV